MIDFLKIFRRTSRKGPDEQSGGDRAEATSDDDNEMVAVVFAALSPHNLNPTPGFAEHRLERIIKQARDELDAPGLSVRVFDSTEWKSKPWQRKPYAVDDFKRPAVRYAARKLKELGLPKQAIKDFRTSETTVVFDGPGSRVYVAGLIKNVSIDLGPLHKPLPSPEPASEETAFRDAASGEPGTPVSDPNLEREDYLHGEVPDINLDVAEPPPADVVGQLIKVPDSAEGHYMKALFDHIRAEYFTTSFTYDDLPPLPRTNDQVPITEYEPSAWVLSVGSPDHSPISPYLRDLKHADLIKSVDIKTFVLTDIGRESSLIVKGAYTSGFLVFDYNLMDTFYGRQVFTIIKSALAGMRERCTFYHGDISSGLLDDLRGNCLEMIPNDATTQPLREDDASEIGIYLVAVWTDGADVLERLHPRLSKELGSAYIGHMTLDTAIIRDDYLKAVTRQLMLTPALDTVADRARGPYSDL